MSEFDLETIRNIVTLHQNYWDEQRTELGKYKNVYECNIWQDESGDQLGTDYMIKINTAEGYTYIEGYQASLFAKNPAVVVQQGMKKLGDKEKAEVVINDFLINCRKEIENCSRLALIYPNAFIKFIPTGADDIFDMVTSIPISPWEIIIDRDAPRWEEQNYMGHVYWLTAEKAKERFGAKKFDYQIKDEFFTSGQNKENYIKPGNMQTDEIFEYVKVVELYDMVNDKLYWWSPNYQHGDKLLDSSEFIPFRDYKDCPVAPISPLYYNCIPDQPLVGYSAISRVYDKLLEQSIIRTFQANAVRKASRQWLIKKGKIDEEQKAQLFSGVDGLAVEVELEDNETLSEVIMPVPHSSLPAEVQHYYAEITNDKDKGSVLMPATRGEASRTTATEASALIFYSSSEIGRLARERDSLIEHMAKVYLSVLSLYVGEAKENKQSTLIYVDKKSYNILPEDLLGDFNIFSSDLSSTPMSDVVKKGDFLQNVGLLIDLGVDPNKIRDYAIKILDLPEDFSEVVAPQQEAMPQPDDPTMLPPDQEAAMLQNAVMNPSVQTVEPMLAPPSNIRGPV